jgi:cytochrome c553
VLGVARAQDAKAGEQKVSMCMGCHNIVGYQSSFPQVYKVPMIAGQDPKYIVSALTEYRNGDRKHPTMRAVAAPLTDKDIADVAAFYSQLGKSVPDARPVPATLETPVPEALKAKLTACTACHGANFATPTDGTIPRLAGQHEDYLYAALKAYRTTDNPRVGRTNATMNGMAAMLDDAEMKAAAEYLSTLPSELKVVPESRFRVH